MELVDGSFMITWCPTIATASQVFKQNMKDIGLDADWNRIAINYLHPSLALE